MADDNIIEVWKFDGKLISHREWDVAEDDFFVRNVRELSRHKCIGNSMQEDWGIVDFLYENLPDSDKSQLNEALKEVFHRFMAQAKINYHSETKSNS